MGAHNLPHLASVGLRSMLPNSTRRFFFAPKSPSSLSVSEVYHLLGPRGEAPLNLALIDVALISGAPAAATNNAMSDGQITAYATFSRYEDGATAEAVPKSLLMGGEAELMRDALLALVDFGHGHDFGAAHKRALRMLASNPGRARALYLAVDFRKKHGALDTLNDAADVGKYGIATVLQMLRPLVTATAPGLNGEIQRLPMGMRHVASYADEFFRSWGNMYWCCNPWSGLLFFIALLISSPFLAVAAAIGVMTSSLAGRALGAGIGLLKLGLLQFNAITISMVIAYNHARTPPFVADPTAAEYVSCIAMAVIGSVAMTLITLICNSTSIKFFGVIPVGLPSNPYPTPPYPNRPSPNPNPNPYANPNPSYTRP